MPPGTLYRRALRRVDRRAHRLNLWRGNDPERIVASTLSHEYQLLREASRLANRLAYAAGIAGPLADPRYSPARPR